MNREIPIKKIILFSILLHICFMFFLNFSDKNNKKISTSNKKKIYVAFKDNNLIKRKEVFDRKKKQVVNSESKNAIKEKVDTKFLSEKDQKVDRQTIAKKIDLFNQGGKGENTEVEKRVKAKKISLSDLGLKKIADSILDSKKIISSRDKVLNKTAGQLDNSGGSGISSNNDYITDIPLGDTTHLNTVEYKFFGFYTRIRQKLEQFWGVSLREKAEKLFRQGRKLSPNETYITSLRIILDGNGKIISVQVLDPSGQKDLDDAAIESFGRAGPFPNPPKDLLKNGLAVLEWGFVVRS